MLENFKETSVDRIIRQIRSLITSGQLKSGDRLPSERKLAERLAVSRNHVRDAIRKLEFYGILKTLPQSGTVVAGIGITALEGLITDVLKLDESDFSSLVETRVILETNGARLAAERRTSEDLIEIQKALHAYENKIKKGESAVEEDLMFHLKIAEASKNAVLKSLMLIITPDIVKNYIQYKVCDDDGIDNKVLDEHRDILQYISDRNGAAATEAMVKHSQDVLEFGKTMK